MTETENCKAMFCTRDAQNGGYCGQCHNRDCDADAHGERFCSRECDPRPPASAAPSKAERRGYCSHPDCDNARAAGADLCSDCLGVKYGGESQCARDGCTNPAGPTSATHCPAHS